MNVVAPQRLPQGAISRAKYRRWAATVPGGRYERVDGFVVAMAPERVSHADVKAGAWLALRRAVFAAGLPCHVYPDGVTLEVGESDYEPDAVLRCGLTLPPDAIVVPDPLVVVEVLSPGTRGTDLTRKLADYFLIPSLQHYLVFWADRQRALHHSRLADGIDTRIVQSGEIVLDPPGIAITLEEVYATLV